MSTVHKNFVRNAFKFTVQIEFYNFISHHPFILFRVQLRAQCSVVMNNHRYFKKQIFLYNYST
jgi:hypothetical protein